MTLIAEVIEGDCLAIMAALDSQSIDMVLCDLPYGTTQNKWDSVIPLAPLWAAYERLSKGPVVLTAQSPFDKILGASNIGQLKYEWIWEKDAGTGFLNAKKAPFKNHENILVFAAGAVRYLPQMRTGFKPYTQKQGHVGSNYGQVKPENISVSNGERYPVTIIKFQRDAAKLHPTQKPVALMEYLIRTYTNEGDTVLDNTCGSGTTGVACVNTGRNFIGIEREPEYVQIARKRIADARACR